jgi:hypothetical protein
MYRNQQQPQQQQNVGANYGQQPMMDGQQQQLEQPGKCLIG